MMDGEPITKGMASRLLLLCGFALAGLGVIAGCLITPRRDEPRGPLSRPFPHATHIEADLECVDCHKSVEDSAAAGLPTKEVCLDCHEDGEEPFEKEIETLPSLDWKTFSDLEDVRFSHAKHIGKEIDCSACHGEIAKAKEVTRAFAPTEDTCLACHTKEGIDLSCRTCHFETRLEKPPPSHVLSWRRMHGPTLREGDLFHHGRSCDRCHGEDSCSKCHREEKPRDHDQAWRVRTHGLVAEIDRDRCRVCHTEDTCIRCHQSGEVLPISHRSPSWGRPRLRHCLTCHQPGDWDGCIVCHKTIPSHALAPPRPADPPHLAATEADCRTCHSSPVGMHVDNGDPCTGCH